MSPGPTTNKVATLEVSVTTAYGVSGMLPLIALHTVKDTVIES